MGNNLSTDFDQFMGSRQQKSQEPDFDQFMASQEKVSASPAQQTAPQEGFLSKLWSDVKTGLVSPETFGKIPYIQNTGTPLGGRSSWAAQLARKVGIQSPEEAQARRLPPGTDVNQAIAAFEKRAQIATAAGNVEEARINQANADVLRSDIEAASGVTSPLMVGTQVGLTALGELEKAPAAVKQYLSKIPTSVRKAAVVAPSVGFAGAGVEQALEPGPPGETAVESAARRAGGVGQALLGSAGAAGGMEIARVGSEEAAAAKASKAVEKQASNLSAALEMGGRSPKGVLTHEEVAQPIVHDFKATAKKLGVTKDDFKGRAGYRAAKEITSEVRNQYDNAYDSLIDPIRNEPASGAALKAADDVFTSLVKDTELIDELKRSNNLKDLENLHDAIASAKTVGDLDDMRKTLNRLSSKYASKSGAQQYQSPIFQEALDTGADAIRRSLYPSISRYYKGTVDPEDIRQLQKLHGAAIQADNMMEATQKTISRAASEESARPGFITRLRGSSYRLTMSPRHAIGGIIERMFPASEVDLFNTRMKRVLSGPEATSKVPPVPPTPETGESYVRGRPAPLLLSAEKPALGTGGEENPPVGPLTTPPPGYSTGQEEPVISLNPAKAVSAREPATGRFTKAYLGGEENKPAPQTIDVKTTPVEEAKPTLTDQLKQKLGTTPEGYNFKVIEAKPNNELTQVSHKDIQIGDSFVDNKGDIRRVVEKKGNIVKTADGSPRTYVGKVPVRELNTPKARLAQGGKLRNATLTSEQATSKLKKSGYDVKPVSEVDDLSDLMGGWINGEGKAVYGPPSEDPHSDSARIATGTSWEDWDKNYDQIFDKFLKDTGFVRIDQDGNVSIHSKPNPNQIKAIGEWLKTNNDPEAYVEIAEPGNKNEWYQQNPTIGEIQRTIDKIWPDKGESQVLQPKKGLYKVLADKLKIGDAFVDDKGDPRRVVEIKGNKVRTADDTVRIYNKTVPLKELNTPKAKIAQGGKMHMGGEGLILDTGKFIPSAFLSHQVALEKLKLGSPNEAVQKGVVRVIDRHGISGFEARDNDPKVLDHIRDRVAQLPFDRKVHIDLVDKDQKVKALTFDDPFAADRWLTRKIGK